MTTSPKWVPIEGGPTSAHIGARVRVQPEDRRYAVTGVLTAWAGPPNAFNPRPLPEVSIGTWTSEVYADDSWFVHRDDDVPDPDADLVERMATALRDGFDAKRGPDVPTWEHLSEEPRQKYRDAARLALAVVRECEATR